MGAKHTRTACQDLAQQGPGAKYRVFLAESASNSGHQDRLQTEEVIMCPIGGVFSRDGEDVAAQIASVMASLHHKNPTEAWLVSKGMSREWERGTHGVR